MWDLSGADLKGANLENAECDEYTKFPPGLNHPHLKGIWLNNYTFVKYNQITRIEIAKNWDKFSEAITDMGYEDEEINDMLEDGDCERYSFFQLPLKYSDLMNLDCDYLEINGKGIYEKLQFDFNIMSVLEDAIYDYKLKLILFLYT